MDEIECKKIREEFNSIQQIFHKGMDDVYRAKEEIKRIYGESRIRVNKDGDAPKYVGIKSQRGQKILEKKQHELEILKEKDIDNGHKYEEVRIKGIKLNCWE